MNNEHNYLHPHRIKPQITNDKRLCPVYQLEVNK